MNAQTSTNRLDGRRGIQEDSGGKTVETADDGKESVVWVEVASTAGSPNAVVIAGRLESCEIPTRVTRESAGVFGFAVNVGILGTARVWVPKDFQEQAQTILEIEWDEEE